jgi:hypothetical protein
MPLTNGFHAESDKSGNNGVDVSSNDMANEQRANYAGEWDVVEAGKYGSAWHSKVFLKIFSCLWELNYQLIKRKYSTIL